jgi:hypothetical protein
VPRNGERTLPASRRTEYRAEDLGRYQAHPGGKHEARELPESGSRVAAKGPPTGAVGNRNDTLNVQTATSGLGRERRQAEREKGLAELAPNGDPDQRAAQ